MRVWSTLALLTICLSAVGQTFLTKKTLTFFPTTYIDTEFMYTDSTGIVIVVQNSLPRWATPLLDSARKALGYSSLIFFSRIINETPTPLELTINFPADGVPIQHLVSDHAKLFLPPDTMTLAKEVDYCYGLTGLETFLETNFNKSAALQKTINPKEAFVFYVGVLFYQPVPKDISSVSRGGTRAGFVLEKGKLFYRINEPGFLIPCGQVVLQKH